MMFASLKDGNLGVQFSIEKESENSDHFRVKLEASLFKIVEESSTLHWEEHTGLEDQCVFCIQRGQYDQVIEEKCIDFGKSLIEKYKRSIESK